MPQSNTIPVDGNDNVLMNLASTISLPTYSAINPAWKGVYFQAIVDVVGTTTLNNYLGVLNPIGSGRTLIALGFICTTYSVSTVTSSTSLEVFRTSAQSGGTQITAPNVNRFVSAFPDPVGDVRIGNPTATLTNGSNPMLGIAPPIGGGAQAAQTVAPTPGASFVFQPGEGIVFQVPAGNTNSRYNMQYIWAEQ